MVTLDLVRRGERGSLVMGRRPDGRVAARCDWHDVQEVAIGYFSNAYGRFGAPAVVDALRRVFAMYRIDVVVGNATGYLESTNYDRVA